MGLNQHIPLDSKQGMEILADFMRTHGFVANEYHERLARKHDVCFSGIAVSRAIVRVNDIAAAQDAMEWVSAD